MTRHLAHDSAESGTYQPGNHSIRTATHKLNRYRDGSLELYNMIRDPAQRDNLAGQPAAAEIQSKLQQALDKEIPASDL